MLIAAVDWLHYLFIIPLGVISVFLILVILVQRGRGGGLTGALGGMGGASAFGTKAGDLFTKITIAVAFVWIVLSMASLKFLNQRSPFNTAQRGTGAASSGTQPGAGTVPATTPGKTSGAGSATVPASGAPAPKSGSSTSPAPTKKSAAPATTPESPTP
jgi:preprotein translocase subunit SecG